MRLLAALLLAAPLLAVQDGVGDERLARFKRYLDRSPYHDQVFQSLLEAARAEGALDGLVEEYRARVTLDGDAAARVVLARLLAEAGAFPAAAEQLLAVSPPTAEARRLTARMQARAGQPAEASRTLAGALELTTDGELLRELHLERADLFLARGLEQDARTAYTTVAELAGQDLVELADLASLMADAGFAGDGVVLLESLRPEVEGDTPRTTQLLAQLGELRERARDGAGALEAYAEALPLLREGHWLRRDLLARSLDLHRRAGSLDRAVTDFRSALVARPGDLETRLSLVAALRLLRRDGEAAEQLRGAVGRHPDDLRLSDQLVAALRELGEDEAVVHELQRALERAPRDARRRFELGCALASAGQVDGADREWTRLIQADPRDTSRADRVAREWARRGEVDRAAGVLRAAIASAPAEVRRYGDLAQLLSDEGRGEAARQVLGQAERAAAGRASELDELAELHLRHQDPRSARRVLELARELDPGRPSRLSRLAHAQELLGDTAGMAATLRDWVELANDEGQGAAARDRYVDLFRGAAHDAEVARLTAGLARARGRAPYLLLAHFRRRAGSPLKAAAVLEAHLARVPDDHAARAQVARDLAKGGRLDPALAQLEELLARDPRRAVEARMEQVRLLARSGRSADVLVRLEQLRRLPPSDPGTWRDVAAAYLRQGQRGDAAECLAQALRLEPEDGRAHLDLAVLLGSLQRTGEAAERFRLAWRHGDGEVRTRALAGLHGMLAETQELRREVRRLKTVVRRDPFDAETPRLLAELSLREGDTGDAVRILGDLLRREGEDPDLLRSRALAYAQHGRSVPALADLRALFELGEDVDSLVLEVATPSLDSGDVARVHELASLMRDPKPMAQALAHRDRARSGVELLERHARRRGELTPSASLYLAGLLEALGQRRQALRVLEDHVEAHGEDWHVTRRMGDLYHGLRDTRRALELGRRMLEQGAPDQALESYFELKASREELTRLRTRELLARAGDAATLEAGLEELARNLYDTPQALDLLRRLRDRATRAGAAPEGTSLGAWLDILDGWTLRFYRANPRLVGPRLEELGQRRFALDAHQWVEYLWLSDFLPPGERGPLSPYRPMRQHVGGERRSPGERALEDYPRDPAVIAAAARWARAAGDGELALAAGRVLVELLAEPEQVARAAARRERALQRHAAARLPDLPAHPDLAPGTELGLLLARLTLPPGETAGPLAAVPDRLEATRAYARDLLAAGRPAEAAAAVEALPEPEALLEHVSLLHARVEVGLTGDALERLAAIAALRDRLAETPPLGTFPGWQDALDAAVAEVCTTWLWRGVLAPA